MSYLLMTGATGLLGEYLLRDLTLAGVNVCVVARSQRDASAEDRIERIMAYWERQLGRLLPRPVVLKGDITAPYFGLDDQEITWISQNCTSLLNNAASLTFESGREDGEPWRSNLTGVQYAIDLCKKTGINEVHHVSTAYVAGLRTGLILESELDLGQAFANEYEASKCAAEIAMREAGFLSLTVFRPAIIVGDSTNGYTSTYHGFYAPLKAMHALLSLQKLTGDPSSGSSSKVPVQAMLRALGLEGNETKNFVPVEWVSACMAKVISTLNLHGQSYHLTPRDRVTSIQTAKAIQAALEKHVYSTNNAADPKGSTTPQPIGKEDGNGNVSQSNDSAWGALGEAFASQISVYKEYWRDDPEYSDSNTRTAMPELPCPDLTFQVLQKMCDFAIESGFGWPKPKWTRQKTTVTTWLEEKGIGLHASDETFVPMFNLVAIGPGGGDVALGLNGDKWEFQYGKKPSLESWLMPFNLLLEENSLEVLVRSGLAIAIPADGASASADAEFSLSNLTMLASKLDHQLVAKHTLQPDNT
jgi:nucleoside-diphosphate-sugar epimerase